MNKEGHEIIKAIMLIPHPTLGNVEDAKLKVELANKKTLKYVYETIDRTKADKSIDIRKEVLNTIDRKIIARRNLDSYTDVTAASWIAGIEASCDDNDKSAEFGCTGGLFWGTGKPGKLTTALAEEKNREQTEARTVSEVFNEGSMTKHDHIYQKYPHVIADSIYKTNTDDKKQIRCKITCKTCGNERDIKIQDAFQVKLCLDCKGKKKKKETAKFLKKLK